jgi:hypothetical protein
MFLPVGYDGTLWGVTFALLLAFFVGPEFYSTPFIFGIIPTRIVEFVVYAAPFFANYPFVAWNIYK